MYMDPVSTPLYNNMPDNTALNILSCGMHYILNMGNYFFLRDIANIAIVSNRKILAASNDIARNSRKRFMIAIK